MYRLRSRAAHHAHDFRLVVPRTMESSISTTRLPSSKLRTGLSFNLHSEIAHRLPRLDERAAHVVVANQSEAEGNAALGRVAHGGGHPGIGDRNHDVGFRRRLARQLPPQFLPALLHRPAKYQAVRPRKYTCSKMQLDCASGGA